MWLRQLLRLRKAANILYENLKSAQHSGSLSAYQGEYLTLGIDGTPGYVVAQLAEAWVLL